MREKHCFLFLFFIFSMILFVKIQIFFLLFKQQSPFSSIKVLSKTSRGLHFASIDTSTNKNNNNLSGYSIHKINHNQFWRQLTDVIIGYLNKSSECNFICRTFTHNPNYLYNQRRTLTSLHPETSVMQVGVLISQSDLSSKRIVV